MVHRKRPHCRQWRGINPARLHCRRWKGYTLHVHTTAAERDTLCTSSSTLQAMERIHPARPHNGSRKGYALHVHTAGDGEAYNLPGYTLHFHTAGGEWKGIHNHVHLVDCGKGYFLTSILLAGMDTPCPSTEMDTLCMNIGHTSCGEKV